MRVVMSSIPPTITALKHPLIVFSAGVLFMSSSLIPLLSRPSLQASLWGSVVKDFVYHACGHEFDPRLIFHMNYDSS